MTFPKYFQKSRPWQLRLGERRIVLLVGDIIMAIIALGVALYFWSTGDRFLGPSLEFLKKRPPDWYFLLPFFWIILMVELYDIHRAGKWEETVRGVLLASIIGLILYFVFYFTAQPRSLPRRGVAGFIVAAAFLTLGWRLIYIRIFSSPELLRRVILVGGGETGQALLQVVNHLRTPPFIIVGIVDDDPKKLGMQIENISVLGSSEQLLEIVAQNQISDIIVAISGEMQGCMFQALLESQERGVEITRMPVAYEELLGRVPIRMLEADWILRSFVDQTRVSGFYELGKRLLDIIGGLIGTGITVILLPFVTLAILIDDGTPVFFTQTRSGRGGQPYKILKFRTMCRNAEENGVPQWAKEDDQRATRLGKFLRKTHIDELPQFLNVLRGEMSLIGPRAERPELVQMFQKHVPFYRARLLVKPGITGWAQVNFGYASTIEETITKLEYDLYYIKHRNFIMDLVILLKTPATMLGFRGR